MSNMTESTIEQGGTYSHVVNGKHIRMVRVVSIDAEYVTVRALAGRLAGMKYTLTLPAAAEALVRS